MDTSDFFQTTVEIYGTAWRHIKNM